MKTSLWRRILALILVFTMLSGQLMVSRAYATGIPTLNPNEQTTQDQPSEPAADPINPGQDSQLPENVLDDIIIIPTESSSKVPEKVEIDSKDQAAGDNPVMPADELVDGAGGIRIAIVSDQQSVNDGDTYSFTVTVADSDLTTEPNITPGKQLTIKLPDFLSDDDMDAVLKDCFAYFEKNYDYNPNTHTLVLTFKENSSGTFANVSFTISMKVDLNGYEGDGDSKVEVGLGNVSSGNISVGVGNGIGQGDSSENAKPYLAKDFLSNYKLSQYGIGNDSFVMTDPDRPIGYAVAFGVNRNYKGSAILTDDLSKGNLALCDSNGNTNASIVNCFVLYVDGDKKLGTVSDGKLIFQDDIIGTITIEKASGDKTGFTVTCTNNPNPNAKGVSDLVVRYYGKVVGNTNDITNLVSLAIDNSLIGSDSNHIRQYDNQGLTITKSIIGGTQNGEIIYIDENTGKITFRITLTQYGTGSLYKDGDVINFDILEDCFSFNPARDGYTIADGAPFDVRIDASNSQKINIVKDGDAPIPTGVYTIDFTVNVLANNLKHGESATNTLGNTVRIYRMAKLTVNKTWTGDASKKIGTGAVFKLYRDDVVIAQTDAVKTNGNISLWIKAGDLNEGTYTYTLREEVDPNSDYVASKDLPVVIKRVIERDRNTHEVINDTVTIVSIDGVAYNAGQASVGVSNKPDAGVGNLTFKKQDSNGDPLDGGRFELYRVNDDNSRTLVRVNDANQFTTVNGSITIKDLPYGKYLVKEVDCPEGYVLTVDGAETAIAEITKVNNNRELILKNKLYRGKITINKVDGNGNALGNVEFKITYTENGQTKTKTATTNGNGVAEFNNLKIGQYSITEVSAPYGYAGFDEPVVVTVREPDIGASANTTEAIVEITGPSKASISGNNIKLTWKNIQQFGNLKIVKYGTSTSDLLEGAEFKLYRNGREVKAGTTDANGTLVFSGLAYADYILKETKAPEGYVISPELGAGVPVSINSTTQVQLSFMNSTAKGSIEIVKVKAGTDTRLTGATFGLYSNAGATDLIIQKTVDGNGVCRFDNLEAGTYYVKEIAAPVGYQLNPNIFTFKVGLDADGNVSSSAEWNRTQTVENSKRLYNLQLIKADETGGKKLPGATFYLEGEGISQTITSDDNGLVIFTNLPFGTYTITETVAPAGYAKAAPFTVTIGSDNTPGEYQAGQVVNYGIVNNEHTKLTVLKVDDKNGNKGLPGTSFVIKAGDQYVVAEGGNGTYIFKGLSDTGTEFVTVTGGVFTLEYLPLGSYTLKETKAPDDYIISQQDTNFTISSASESVTVGNTQIKAKLELRKTDEYGKLLEGIGFTLRTATGYVQGSGQNGAYTYQSIGETPYVFYTNADGRLSVDGLLWGSYTLDEDPATTPVGLIPISGTQFAVTADSHSKSIEISLVNSRELGSISFNKVDENLDPLSGAVFKLEPVSADGSDYAETLVRYAVSDDQGVVTFDNLPYGIYKLTEYLAPSGKQLSGDVYYVRVGNATVGDADITLTETPFQWVNDDEDIVVVFKKISTDGQPLTGAIFNILAADQKTVVIENLTINDLSGKAIEMSVGTYYLVEVKAPENYVMEQTPVMFKVTEEGPNVVVMKNAPFTGSLVLNKVDKDSGAQLAGAEFAIYERADFDTNAAPKALYNLVTDSEGKAVLQNIPFGSYVVVETKAPNGYEHTDEVQYFTIGNSGDEAQVNVNLTFKNEKTRYIITVGKQDILTGEWLTGASFAVYDGNGFYQLVTTGTDGKVVLEVPHPGTYYIQEIAMPEGYTLDPSVYEVVVTGHTAAGTVLNPTFVSNDYPTRMVIRKQDNEGKLLDGAVFELYRLLDDEKVLVKFSVVDGTYHYDSDGEIDQITAGEVMIEYLPAGKYILHEVEAPETYMVLADHEFIIDGSGYDQPQVTIHALNLPITKGVAICKENADGIRLEGAEFAIFNASGEEIKRVVTTASGYGIFGELESGKYVIREVKAPEGYQKLDTEVAFEIDGDGNFMTQSEYLTFGSKDAPLFVFSFINEPIEHELQLRKVSAMSGAALEGAQFRISGGAIDRVFTTGRNGLTETFTLPIGEYMLSEIMAPAGYTLNTVSHKILVQSDGILVDGEALTGAIPVYTISNAPKNFNFGILKLDEKTSMPLAGAGFLVTGPDGTKYDLLTDGQGMTASMSLIPGTYTVQETVAPIGYNLPADSWKFTFEEGKLNVTEVQGEADFSFIDDMLIMELTNERTAGSLLIQKVDAKDHSKVLADAQFQIRNAEGKLVWFTVRNGIYHKADASAEGAGNVMVTNSMGQALLDGLEYGEYTVTEIQAPAGYQIKTENVLVKLTKDQETVNLTVENNELIRKVTVRKVSDGKDPVNLMGAVFTLYAVEQDGHKKAIDEKTTGYDGVVEFTVPYGDYIIIETKAPDGYEMSYTDPYIFSYNENTPDDHVFTYTFVNEKSLYSLEVYKYDASNKDIALAGAEFAVTNSLGYTRIIKSGADGIARLENLAYDDYTIREVTAPAGYYLSDAVYTVSREDLAHNNPIRIEAPNTFILGSVHLKKLDYQNHDLTLHAEFTVSDSDGNLLKWEKVDNGYVLSTDGDTTIQAGDITLSGIPAGVYTLTEIKAPDGYAILEESRTFEINANNAPKVIEIVVDNLKLMTAVGVVKKDSTDPNSRLSNAEFTLFAMEDGKPGAALKKLRTDGNGIAVFTDLTMGSYRIVESKAPYGYIPSDLRIDFEVDAEGKVLSADGSLEVLTVGNVFIFDVENTPIEEELIIKKVSSLSGKTLPGAVFTVSGNGETFRVTTGEDGTASVNLIYGDYVIQEILAPNGYVLNDTKYLVKVSDEGIMVDGVMVEGQISVFTVENEPETFRFGIAKQDETTKQPLEGAIFTLITPDGERIKLGTDAEGMTDLIDLIPGEYTVSETVAPEGYDVPLKGWSFTVEEGTLAHSGDGDFNDGVLILTVDNKRSTGSLLIKKTDADDGKLLSGAKFLVQNEAGEYIRFTYSDGVYHVAKPGTAGSGTVMITNAAGEAKLDGLVFGNYTVIEYAAPACYDKVTDPILFKITKLDPNGVAVIEVKNEKTVREVIIIKQSADEEPVNLMGAVFTLYAVNADGSKTAIDEQITNENGMARFEVTMGNYVIEETKAPEGYELANNGPYEFSYNAKTTEDEKFTYTFVNEKTRYDLEVYKYDAEQKDVALAGAEFAFTNSKGYTVVVKTDEKGIARLEDVAYDDYTIQEVKAPEGYYLSDEVFTVAKEDLVHNQTVRVEASNTFILGSVRIKKVDYLNPEKILEAEFIMTDSQGNQLAWEKTEGGYLLNEEGEPSFLAGEVTLSNLPAGTYTLTEVRAPNGYAILEESYTFEINAENAPEGIELVVENLELMTAVGIIKKDCRDKESRLAGAEFTLYRVVDGEIGEALSVLNTDGNGFAIFTKLTMGSYRIVETKAPYGFILDEVVIDFVVDAIGQVRIGNTNWEYNQYENVFVIKVINEPIYEELLIKKVSALSGEVLPGAVFNVTGNGETLQVATSEDGTVAVNLAYGDYVIQEILAPSGYVLDDTKYLIHLDDKGITVDGVLVEGEIPIYTISNEPETFLFGIVKQDEDTQKPLEGAVFAVTAPDGKVFQLGTGTEGMTDQIKLIPGTYTVKEIVAPSGYDLTETEWSFTVDEGLQNHTGDGVFEDNVLTLTLTNRRSTGSLLIRKSDADDGKALGGAKFLVQNEAGEYLRFTYSDGVYHVAKAEEANTIAVLITNVSGEAKLDGLVFGNYTITEHAAPVGYQLLEEPIDIKVTKLDPDGIVIVDAPNHKLVRQVTIIKQSADEEPVNLIGAVFALYSVAEDGTKTFISEATTGYNGKVTFDVTFGNYVIEETKAPEGYELANNGPYEFSFNEETPEDLEFTYTFVNEKTLYGLEIFKFDAANPEILLEGAEFAVTNSSGYTKIIKTGADGIAKLEDIAFDDYTIKEVVAPAGYYLDETVHTVTKDELLHNTPIRIEVPNTYILGSVKLMKVDCENPDVVLDAEFTVSDSEGNLLKWIEVEDGYELADEGVTVIHAGSVTLSNLPAGTYTLTEVKAPEGYVILEESKQFEITAENAEAGIEIAVKNLLRKTAVGIIKMDADDQKKRLEGAEFTLYAMNGTDRGDAIMTVTTDKDGLAVFTDLPMGKYRIEETKAPYGYELWKAPIDFTVDADGKVLAGSGNVEAPVVDEVRIFGIVNKCILKTLTIKKVSEESGKALAGAVFSVTGKDGTQNITTGEDGTAVLTLPYGEYVLQEIIAPEGYVLDDTKYLLNFNENGVSLNGKTMTELVLTIQNMPVKYPVTLHKIDAKTGKPLAGAVITIKGEGFSYEWKTNAEGGSDTIYLAPGTYTITEIQAPNGYKLPLNGWTLKVSEDGKVSVEGKGIVAAVSGCTALITIDNEKKPPEDPGDIGKTGEIGNSTLLLTGASMMLMSFSGLMFLLVDERKRRMSGMIR